MRASVHSLVVNGVRVVERGLRSLLGVVDEVVLVDAGSTDGTAGVVEDFCGKNGLVFQCVLLSPVTHPDLFLLDEPSTWRRPVPGPFTGLHVLRRFDLARNLGLDRCTGKYVVKLDADDEVLDPGGVVKVFRFLDANSQVDVVMCPYEVAGSKGEVLYDRVWRNGLDARFAQAIHEYLNCKHYVGLSGNWAVTELGRTRDHRDSRGDGVRVPRRNYKVFLAEYERREAAGEVMDPLFLTSTIGEVEEVDPDFGAFLRRVSSVG